MHTNVAVIYYSSTGTVHRLATAAAAAASAVGAEVRLRRAAELASEEVVATNPQWRQHLRSTEDVPEASVDDIEWADVVLIGTPTRYGSAAAQIRQLLDQTGPLWQRGALADKVYGAFATTGTKHGGHESTLLGLSATFHHFGGVIVPPGYTDAVQFMSGNPYGTSATQGDDLQVAADAIGHQVRRSIQVARKLQDGNGAERVAS